MLCSITSKKVCELKWGNIGIVEKVQETRFGMCPKYSRCSGIASWNHVCVVCHCKITIIVVHLFGIVYSVYIRYMQSWHH